MTYFILNENTEKPSQHITSVTPFQPSVVFHIEKSHLSCSAKQLTGFYVKRTYINIWVCSKFAIKTLKRRHLCPSVVFLFFNQFNIFLLSWRTQCFTDFENVSANWVAIFAIFQCNIEPLTINALIIWYTQPALTCSKSMTSLLLTLNKFHTLLWCFHC